MAKIPKDDWRFLAWESLHAQEPEEKPAWHLMPVGFFMALDSFGFSQEDLSAMSVEDARHVLHWFLPLKTK